MYIDIFNLASYTPKDPKIIRDETLNIVIAGRDTVCSARRMNLCLADDTTFLRPHLPSPSCYICFHRNLKC